MRCPCPSHISCPLSTFQNVLVHTLRVARDTLITFRNLPPWAQELSSTGEAWEAELHLLPQTALEVKQLQWVYMGSLDSNSGPHGWGTTPAISPPTPISDLPLHMWSADPARGQSSRNAEIQKHSSEIKSRGSKQLKLPPFKAGVQEETRSRHCLPVNKCAPDTLASGPHASRSPEVTRGVIKTQIAGLLHTRSSDQSLAWSWV